MAIDRIYQKQRQQQSLKQDRHRSSKIKHQTSKTVPASTPRENVLPVAGHLQRLLGRNAQVNNCNNFHNNPDIRIFCGKSNYVQKKPVFSSKRIQRGFYKTTEGEIISAETYATINIVRKVIPDTVEGIVGLPFILVILELWIKITTVVV